MDVINVSYIRLMVLLDTLEYHGIQLYEYIDAHTHTHSVLELENWNLYTCLKGRTG